LACEFAFAGFGFSALRFIVAVIVLGFVVFDPDVVPGTFCDAADEGEGVVDARFGGCSAILLG
jgi:hypothetical protein